MYMMFVDESGDPGLSGGGSKAYVRVGVAIHGWKWKTWHKKLQSFKINRGLSWSSEIKANHLRKGAGVFEKWNEAARKNFMIDLAKLIGAHADISLLCVAVDKLKIKPGTKAKPDVMSLEILLKRYDSFLRLHTDKAGIVILDPAEETKDDSLRYYQSYLQAGRLRNIVEGTFFAKSHTSNMIQVADFCSNVFYHQFCGTERIPELWESLKVRVPKGCETTWPS